MQSAAAALGPLSKPEAYEDLKKLETLLARVKRKLDSLRPLPGAALKVVDDIERWRRERKEYFRTRLSRELKAACEAAGLEMLVVSREQPIELRIPPFAVVIDLERASAELRFARERLAQVAADPPVIVDAVKKLHASIETQFDPAEFFDRCHAAWKAARAATASSDRVEILEFLPYLAVGMQRDRFKVAPTRENYVDYRRAQFAYDILRLRRAHSVHRGGWRLNLGVATGTTASDKRRSIYVEDERGHGEYKLTVYFTKDEDPT